MRSKRVRETWVDQRHDARGRTLRTASQAKGFEELGERRGVLRAGLDDDGVGLRLAEGMRRLYEGAGVGRAHTRDDLSGRRECDLRDATLRCVLATVQESDAKRSAERNAGLLDRGLRPGRDRHRDAVVVRAASSTKAAKMRRASGETSLIRSGCH